MAIVRWTPVWKPAGPRSRDVYGDISRLRNEMSSLFDRFTGSASPAEAVRGGVFPPLNISEDADNLYVTAELPGISAGELDISVENDKLTLRGERKIADTDQKANYHRREREAGIFRRVISLPARIDTDKVTAVSKNGVLEIVLPKAAAAKPRQIDVQSA